MTNQVDQIMRTATELFQTSPEWVTFHQRILGRDGIVQRMFTDAEEQAQFELSKEYQQLQRMVAQLRGKELGLDDDASKEPQRVITVRMPKSLHQALKQEAHSRQTSINKLCIAKLIKKLDEQQRREQEEVAQRAQALAASTAPASQMRL